MLCGNHLNFTPHCIFLFCVGPSSSHDKETVPSESLDSTMEHFVEPSPGRLPSFTLSKSHFAGKNNSGERQLPKESPLPSFSGERTSNPVEVKTGSKKGKTPGTVSLNLQRFENVATT